MAFFFVLCLEILSEFQNNLSNFSLIDIQKCATSTYSLDGSRSHVIGNRCSIIITNSYQYVIAIAPKCKCSG